MTTQTEKCDRPHQTGMEREWEKWILDILNFLKVQDIPFYTRDQNGVKIPGKDKSIGARLNILQSRITKSNRDAMTEYRAHNETKRLLTGMTAAWNDAEKLLEQIWGIVNSSEAVGEKEVHAVYDVLAAKFEKEEEHDGHPIV